ncbi:MAG TPA: MmgE/PrpD family protein [Actinomycetota bacterium]|nr:MmgE/PrpD family protein [Actinomycetota bacterium]
MSRRRTLADRISSILARYASDVAADGLGPQTDHEVRRRLLDALGVGVAGLDEAVAVAARRYAGASAGLATVWGTEVRASVEAAGFANGVAVRCLDFNDTYLSLEPLHPSDTIAALLALAEERGLGARALLEAIAIAYEVGVTLCDAMSLRARGWDHVNVTGIATACGAGHLVGMPTGRLEHAVALAAVPHAAMRETRTGELSMWKGAAAAHAARLGVSAALLADAGMTGPARPFEGRMGFVRQLLGEAGLDVSALGRLEALEEPRRILDTHVKWWPVEYHAQSAVDAALAVRRDLGDDPSGIASVRVETFRAAHEIIAGDPEKWDPHTRETADHSLPFIVCAALQDGNVTRRTFELERIRSPDTLALLARTTVGADNALTAGYPSGIPNRLVVTTTEGATYTREVTYPRGHARNPMTDDELTAKYRANVAERWGAGRSAAVEDAVWRLGEADELDRLMEGLRG